MTEQDILNSLKPKFNTMNQQQKQGLEIWVYANDLIDYWIDQGMSKKTSMKAAKASAYLLMMNDKTNEIIWHRVYNYLTKTYFLNYETKKKGDQDSCTNG